MRALVTGACGFVGRYLSDHLIEKGHDVLGLTFVDSSDTRKYRTARVDVSDYNACTKVISSYKPDVIYHLAGISFVPEAESNFEQALKTNVGGTSNIYRTCHLLQQGIKVVFVSSAEVYGRIEAGNLPITEEQPLRPMNNYSLSKAMAEMVADRYVRGGHVRSVVMRPFNHIGAGQNNRFVASSFAYQLASIARGKHPPHIKVGNLSVKRDFTDVRDIVRAYGLAAEKGDGIYNLSSGKAVAIRSILDTLIEISGVKVEVGQDEARMRGAEVPEIYGSYARAERDLGWRPEHQLSDTLKELYNYWLERV